MHTVRPFVGDEMRPLSNWIRRVLAVWLVLWRPSLAGLLIEITVSGLITYVGAALTLMRFALKTAHDP